MMTGWIFAGTFSLKNQQQKYTIAKINIKVMNKVLKWKFVCLLNTVIFVAKMIHYDMWYITTKCH